MSLGFVRLMGTVRILDDWREELQHSGQCFDKNVN